MVKKHKRAFRLISLLVMVLILLLGTASAAVEQVWYTSKTNGCKLALPTSPEVKATEVSWTGACKDGLADGDGTIAVKYYYLVKEKELLTLDGTVIMKSGLANGKVSLRWSLGATFEGEYLNGNRSSGIFRFNGESYEGQYLEELPHGKGLSRYKIGDVYEGNWEKGKRQGSGTLTGADGKVKYQGEWISDHPASDPALNRPLNGFLSIPWNTGREETEKLLKSRQGNFKTSFWYQNSMYWGVGKDTDNIKFVYVLGKFNGETAYLRAHFFEEKFAAGRVVLFNTEQEVMSKFTTVKNDLTERYGPPTKEEGKYLDSMVQWEFQDGNFIVLRIHQFGYDKMNLTAYPDIREIAKPYNVTIDYVYGPFYKRNIISTIPKKGDY